MTFTATATNGGTAPAYNFYKNGVSVQNSASNTYSTTTLGTNDSVWVVLTSNAPCATTTTATSTKLHMVVSATIAPAVSLSASSSSICSGTSVILTAAATGGGTTPSYTFYLNGSAVQSGTGNTYTSSSLNNNDSIYVVLTSSSACASPTTSTSTKVGMTVTQTVTPTVSLSASLNNICAGTSVTFTATYTNGGSTPAFNFIKNGTSVQSGASTTYTTTGLSNNDSVWVVITGNAPCASAMTAISTKVRMIVIANVTPAISLASSQNAICAGASVIFTATGFGSGASPSYAFFLNGTSVQSGAGNTYTTSALNNNDSVWVVLTSNAPCASPLTATSSKVRVTVTSSMTPAVTLTPSQNNICPNTSVTLTATATNGGTTPTYHFYVNGATVQNGTSNTYTSAAFTNGATVRVVVTSNAACRTADSATSSTVTITVNSSVVPAVSLAPTAINICAGSPATLSATATGGGASPTYNFFVNGASVQSGLSNAYTSSALQNNDSIWVVLTSNSACAAPSTATSVKVRATVTQNVTPSVSLAASQNNICAGSSVTLTATPANGGITPSYHFYVNGATVQNGSANTYTSTTLTNGSTIKVVITSNAPCRTIDSATSNTVTMTINPTVTPTVTISPTATTVCAGTSVTFTTTAASPGTAPVYTFYVNGTSVQSGSATSYTTTTLHDNDSVWVTLISNVACVSPGPATSVKLHITITPIVVPAVSLSASQNNICAGTQVTFTAAATNGGAAPLYNFYVNGTSVQNGAGNTYSSSALQNSDSVWVVLTSNANCASPATTQSNKTFINVGSPVTPSVTLTASQNNVCAGTAIIFTAAPVNGGSAPQYNFYVNGSSVQNGSQNTFTTSTLSSGDSVWVILTSSAACATPASATSGKVTAIIIPATHPAVDISASDTIICGGALVAITATSIDGGTLPQYQFLVNGSSVQNSGSSTWSSSTLTNGAIVKVVLTSNAICATPAVVSDSLLFTVYQAGATTIPAHICTGSSYSFFGRTLTQAGTYYDTLSTVHGCDSVITLQLAVNSPVASQYNDSLCKGRTYNFNGAILTTTGTYTDTLIATTGCDSVVTLHLSFATRMAPAIHQAGRDSLMTTAFASYQWLRNNVAISGATGQAYVPTSSGSYRVVINNGAGCSDTSAAFIFTATGISAVAKDISLQLYPNPASGEINIHVEGSNGTTISIKVYNLQGQMVTSINASARDNAYSIHTGDLATGMYYLHMQGDDWSAVRKVEVIK